MNPMQQWACDMAERLLCAPMVEWAALRYEVQQRGPGAALQVERELDAIIQQATRARGYVQHVHGPHPEAVNRSNCLVAKVRRALGYAIARHDVHF